MNKAPAYQWYPKDILSSQRVAMMDAKTECWYRRALDFCWVHGSVPSDPKKLAAMIGKGCTAKVAEVEICPMFSIHPEDSAKLIHDRQEQERMKQAEWLRKSSEAGKKSAQARAAKSQPTLNQTGNVGSTNLQPESEGWLPNGSNQSANQMSTLQSSSSSSIPPIGGKQPPHLKFPMWPGLNEQQSWVAEQLLLLTASKLPRPQISEEAKRLLVKKPEPPYPYICTWAKNLLQADANSTKTEEQSAGKSITTGYKNL